MNGLKMLNDWTFASYVQLMLHLVMAHHETDYGTLCPYTKLCQTDALYTWQPGDTTRSTCCAQCSCADNCYRFKRCCPDKIWKTHNHREKVAKPSADTIGCLSQDKLYNRYFGKQDRNTISNDFHVVTSCPENSDVNDTLSEAVYRCYNGNGKLHDAHFVSDVNNETLYFNKYCAQCNGVENIVNWHLKASCKTTQLDFKHENERDNLTIYNCDIYSIPPSEELGLKFLCHSTAIRVCNESGLWDYYDPELERNCTNYDIAFTGNSQNKQSLNHVVEKYANVYCFLCNMPQGTLVENECHNSFFSVPRTFIFPFTYIIVDKHQKNKSLQKPEAKCKVYEIWDQLMMKCREFLCPLGAFPSYGECVSLVDKVNGMSFHIYHQFNITYEQYEALGIDHNSFLNMISKITNIHALQSQGCVFCSILTAISSSGHITSSTTVASTESCSIQTALQTLHTILKDGVIHFNMKPQSLNLNLEIELLHGQSLYYEFSTPINRRVHYQCRKGEMFSLELVYCPGFRYEYHELVSIGLDNTTVDKLITQSFMFRPDTYMICHTQYRQLIEELTSGSRSTWIHDNNILFLSLSILFFSGRLLSICKCFI